MSRSRSKNAGPFALFVLICLIFMKSRYDFAMTIDVIPATIEEKAAPTADVNGGRMSDGAKENIVPAAATNTEVLNAEDDGNSEKKSEDIKERPRRKWAYAFLIGGCNTANPIGYLGYIYNVVIAAHILHDHGSVADVIVMIHMTHDSQDDKLPADHEAMLTALPNMRVKYLPKAVGEHSFFAINMQKFRLLQFTEYSRIFFMDSDLIPYCNMDYLFELSESEEGKTAPLMKNIVFAWLNTPANGGNFILAPESGDWERLEKFWKERQLRDMKELPYPHFSEKKGWGKEMIPPYDYALNLEGSRYQTWKWYASFSDQGLLYYWPKYIKKSLTTISNFRTENWSPVTAEQAAAHPDANWTVGEDVAAEQVKIDFNDYSCVAKIRNGKRSIMKYSKDTAIAPYRDFKHFTGRNKPFENPIDHEVTKPKTPLEFWFYRLALAQRTILKDNPHMQSINVTRLPKRKHPNGDIPLHNSAMKMAQQFAREANETKA